MPRVRHGRLVLAISAMAAWLGASAWADDLMATIVGPPAGEPAFGEIIFEARIDPVSEVERVELWLDKELVETLSRPPFVTHVDVGHENLGHRFEVRAYDRQGRLAEALMVTPSIEVDDLVDASLRQLYATVTSDGERVLDLEARDFLIYDNGVAQHTVTFNRGDVRLTAAVLIDASASMRGQRLTHALEGASSFLGGLRDVDDASMVLFSDRLLRATSFSNDASALLTELLGIEAAGGTALYDHLYLALKQLEQRQGRRVVIVLSDGVDSHSALRMEQLSWMAQRSRALIYWIQTGPEKPEKAHYYSAWKGTEDFRADLAQLGSIVAESGGRAVHLPRIEDAGQAFQEILGELREQYVLGYHPSELRHDGSWRQIEVRLRPKGYKLRVRGGYVDY